MLNLPPLYPITDTGALPSLSDQVGNLGEAGFPLVQFRGKPLDASRQWQELRLALDASAKNGGWPMICVNDRSDLALLATCEGLPPWGVHLGQTDLPPGEASRLSGLETMHFGTSTHTSDEWDTVDQSCDHAGVGPIRATVTKGDHSPPIGIEGLRAGCSILRSKGIAPIAIGGLTMLDAAACFEAGAESMAMIGEISRSGNPTEMLWLAQELRWKSRPPLCMGRGVALVGGSGSGKSTLAMELGAGLGLPVRDVDNLVARRAGKSIAKIFSEDGERAFRSQEIEASCVAFESPAVLALGAGAWESQPVRTAAHLSGFAILWIAENPGTAWNRVAKDPARPLAQDRSAFLERWRMRSPRWAEAAMVLPLGRTPARLAEALMGGMRH